MKKKKIILILTTMLGLLLLVILFQNGEFYPGFDSGTYLAEFKKFETTQNQKDAISIWMEPFLFISHNTIDRIINISPVVIYLQILILYGLIICFLILWIRRQVKEDYLLFYCGISMITGTILLQISSNFFLKQLIGTAFLMVSFYYLSGRFFTLTSLFITIIFLSHRSEALFIILGLIIFFIYKKGDKKIFKISLLSLIMSSPYLFHIYQENIIILTEFINKSVSGSSRYHQGASLVNTSRSSINIPVLPMIDLISKENPLILLGILGFLKARKKYLRNITIFFCLSVLFTLPGVNAANRFILLLFISLTFFSVYFLKKIQKKYFIILISIVVMIITSGTYLTNKKVYVNERDYLKGVVEEILPTTDTFIVAEGSISSVLSQMGYSTSVNQNNYEKSYTGHPRIKWSRLANSILINGPDTKTPEIWIKEYPNVYLLVKYSNFKNNLNGYCKEAPAHKTWKELSNSPNWEKVIDEKGKYILFHKIKHSNGPQEIEICEI